MSKAKLIVSLSLLALFLAGCGALPLRSDEKRFYEGTEGVEVSFVNPTPPPKLPYQGNEVTFPVEVRVKNEGASITKGGIYISGYDPTIIDIEEVDEERDFFDDCMYDIEAMDISYLQFSGSLRCERVDIPGLGEVGLGIAVDNRGFVIDISDVNLGSMIDDLAGTDIFADLGLDNTDITFSYRDGSWRLDVSLGDVPDAVKHGSRGPFFLQAWAAYDFTRNQGMEFLLAGDSPNWPGGEETYIDFHGKILRMPEGLEKTRQPIMITSCYLYTTHAAPTVCIDPDPYTDVEKVCGFKTYNGERGQGAPVAITSVTQVNSGSWAIFNIHIENRGTGQVFNPARMDRCSPYYPLPVTEEDLDVVLIGMAYIGERMLPCFPDPYMVRLHDGKGFVQCALDMGRVIEEEGLLPVRGYETPLILELWYGYSQTIRRNIEIQRLKGPMYQ